MNQALDFTRLRVLYSMLGREREGGGRKAEGEERSVDHQVDIIDNLGES